MDGNSNEKKMQTKNTIEDIMVCRNSPGLPEEKHCAEADENSLNKKKTNFQDKEILCKKRRMSTEENSKVVPSATQLESSPVNLPEVVTMLNNKFEGMNQPKMLQVTGFNANCIPKVYSSGSEDESDEKKSTKQASECSSSDYRKNRDESDDRPDISFSYDTDHGEICVCGKLSNQETFPEAINILTVELKKRCTNKIDNSFISMLQCINGHVMELQGNKDDYETKLKGYKSELVKHFQVIMCNLSAIIEIYSTFLKQYSNHFSLIRQRKSIKSWKEYAEKLSLDVKQRINELNYRENPDDNNSLDKLTDQLKKLKEDQSSLRCHLTEMTNQITTMRSDHRRDFEHLDEQIMDVQVAVESYQQSIRTLRERENEQNSDTNEQNTDQESINDVPLIPQNEARMISLTCIFLCSHPGASTNTIHSYLNQMDLICNIRIVEEILRRFTTVFQEEVTTVDGQLRSKWYYLGIWELEHAL